jgi:predicted glycoside hydrolase/deacetylase ChbG (UPF0249 family)
MDSQRYLVVVADDYGIGPATSQGILDLAREGLVDAAVLLVNSPYAENAVRAWQRAGRPMELGWHPCLTLDAPLLPAVRVASLVSRAGHFHSLGRFLRRAYLGLIRAEEVAAELLAQHRRFVELVGHLPAVVNSHQHVQLFGSVGGVIRALLSRQRPLPYLRRVREPWGMLARIPGARWKRAFLSLMGRREGRHQDQLGFPGNDWLAGITDPPCVQDPAFLSRWLSRVPGKVVELACHPGYWDPTPIGRDCTATDGQVQRRVCEFNLLRESSFPQACQEAGFRRVAPSQLAVLQRVRAA